MTVGSMPYPLQNSSSEDAPLKPLPLHPQRVSSHYHDLSQLQPEDDLIQLSSRPPTPRIQTENELPNAGDLRPSGPERDRGAGRNQAKQYVWQYHLASFRTRL